MKWNIRLGMDLINATTGLTFEKNKTLLKHGGFGPYKGLIGNQLKIQYHLNSQCSIEGIGQFTQYRLGVYDDVVYNATHYEDKSDHDDDDPRNTRARKKICHVGASKNYYSIGAAAYYHLQPNSYGFWNNYVAAGFLINHRIGNAEYRNTSNFTDSNQTLILTSSFIPHFTTCFIEFGFNFNDENSLVTYIGLKYVFAPKIVFADYTKYAEDRPIASDRVVARGSYLSISMGLGIGNLKCKKPKFKKLKEEAHPYCGTGKIWDPYATQYKPTFADTDAKANNTITKPEPERLDTIKPATGARSKPPKSDSIPAKTIAGRPVLISNKMNVQTESVTIYIWDFNIVDGDSISLNLNGQWVLRNRCLKAEKMMLKLALKPGENELVMHAISEGTIKPCTAEIEIEHGYEKEVFILNSSLGKSSSIIINRLKE